MMLVAILSVTAMAIIAGAIGFVCGKDAGRQQAERNAAAAALNRQLSFRKAAAASAARRPIPYRPRPILYQPTVREGSSGVAQS